MIWRVFFDQQLDPEANTMAAFTAADPTDRAAFDNRWQRALSDNTITKRTILAADDVAGHVAVYEADDLDGPEVTYWLGKRWWGQGIATRAVEQLLIEVPTRPLYGRCAKTNPASLRVLQKCGFKVVGEDEGFANAHGKVVGDTSFDSTDSRARYCRIWSSRASRFGRYIPALLR